jgi:hypothetical protein
VSRKFLAHDEKMSEQVQLGAATWERWRDLDVRMTVALRSEIFSEREKGILRVIAGHKGAAKAIGSQEVAKAAGMEWCERARRTVAGVVETAVLLFKVPIGGLRGKPHGYFLIVTADDLSLALGPLNGEFRALLRRIRALSSREQAAAMFGQTMLKLDSEEAA